MSGARRGKPVVPKVGQLPAYEEDIQQLLLCFEERVQQGAPLCLSTLKQVWQELRFSYIFETRPADTYLTDYVQCLFASALDCLEMPLRRNEGPGSPAEQDRSGTTGVTAAGHQSLVLQHKPAAPSSAAADLAELAASDDEEDHLDGVQDIAAKLNQAATPRERFTLENKAAGDLDINAVEAMLDVLPDVSPHLHLLNSPRGKSVAARTSCGAAAPNGEDPMLGPDQHVIFVGSIFLLFALYHAQPGAPRVQIYVPLRLLRHLQGLLGSNDDVDGILKSLVRADALVVGAVRRPFSGTGEARQAARAVRSVIAPDRSDQERILRDAMATLKTSANSWQSLQHVDLLCSSYRKCQSTLWAPSNGTSAQGIFNLDLGSALGKLAGEIDSHVNGILAGEIRLRERGRSKNAGSTLKEAIKIAKKQADGEGNTAEDGPTASETEPERAVLGGSLGAATASSAGYDEDMPSLDTLGLGLGIPGIGGGSPAEEEASDAAFEDAQLPKVLQLIQAREQVERNRARTCMHDWQKRNNALLAENASRAVAGALDGVPSTSNGHLPDSGHAGDCGKERTQADSSGRVVAASGARAPGGASAAAPHAGAKNSQSTAQARKRGRGAHAGDEEITSRATRSKKAAGSGTEIQAATVPGLSDTMDHVPAEAPERTQQRGPGRHDAKQQNSVRASEQSRGNEQPGSEQPGDQEKSGGRVRLQGRRTGPQGATAAAGVPSERVPPATFAIPDLGGDPAMRSPEQQPEAKGGGRPAGSGEAEFTAPRSKAERRSHSQVPGEAGGEAWQADAGTRTEVEASLMDDIALMDSLLDMDTS